ncbi:hypothetical protein [Actinoplanes sp. GCM10030250]|uniref:hypothetical protein n=1 Tax=Actinoplanes sp. GCM10030250 TaxID=3273376 RepID=UPI0036228853
MTDRYSISDAPAPATTPSSTGRLRPLLWLVLIVSLAANATASALGATLLSVAFGVVTLGSGAALAVNHYRHRDS